MGASGGRFPATIDVTHGLPENSLFAAADAIEPTSPPATVSFAAAVPLPAAELLELLALPSHAARTKARTKAKNSATDVFLDLIQLTFLFYRTL